MADVAISVAFLAGVVSFLSPCILPLVPGFLAYLAGSSTTKSVYNRKEVFLNAVLFVLGFAIVFSLLGIALNTVLERVAYDVQVWLARIGGLIIVFFGLYLTGLLKVGFLEREYKFKVGGTGYYSSLLFGAAFAIGWTPCVGAVLGSIFGLAATTPGSAFTLLLAYSIGLGIPFLLVGAFTAEASEVIKRYAGMAKIVTVAFGVLLIILGILVFTQEINKFASFDLLERLLGS